jgi:hypothetical protein
VTSRKSCRKVEKCDEARGSTNYVTIRRIPVACWISKATCTHSHAPWYPHARVRARTHKYIIPIAFSLQQWFAKTPQCYVIRTLSVLFHLSIKCPDIFLSCGITLKIRCRPPYFEDSGSHTDTLCRTPLSERLALAEAATCTTHNRRTYPQQAKRP